MMGKFCYGCITLTGSVREENQDNYLLYSVCGQEIYSAAAKDEELKRGCSERGVFAVFDGIGGGNDGGRASEICAEYLLENAERLMTAPSEMMDILIEMNGQVCGYSAERKLGVCGTTAAVVLADGGRIYASNVGDSRIYHFRTGLTQISADHVMSYHGRRALTQFVGIPENELCIEPHLCTTQLEDGAGLLICSDGLTDMVDEARIAEILMGDGSADEKCGRLADEALAAGGRDNITIIVLEWNG